MEAEKVLASVPSSLSTDVATGSKEEDDITDFDDDDDDDEEAVSVFMGPCRWFSG